MASVHRFKEIVLEEEIVLECTSAVKRLMKCLTTSLFSMNYYLWITGSPIPSVFDSSHIFELSLPLLWQICFSSVNTADSWASWKVLCPNMFHHFGPCSPTGLGWKMRNSCNILFTFHCNEHNNFWGNMSLCSFFFEPKKTEETP